jgi:hypothetical protein
MAPLDDLLMTCLLGLSSFFFAMDSEVLLTPPCKQMGAQTLSLYRRMHNRLAGSPLVKISASWSRMKCLC